MLAKPWERDPRSERGGKRGNLSITTHLLPVEVLERRDERFGDPIAGRKCSRERRVQCLVGDFGIRALLSSRGVRAVSGSSEPEAGRRAQEQESARVR